MKRTPEGVGQGFPTFYYHMFALDKAHERPEVPPAWRAVGKLWGETMDKSVLPTEPDRTFHYTIPTGSLAGRKVAIDLDPEQYHDLKAAVGAERLRRFDSWRQQAALGGNSPDVLARTLGKVWEEGQTEGEKQWATEQLKRSRDFVQKVRQALATQPKTDERYKLMTGVE